MPSVRHDRDEVDRRLVHDPHGDRLQRGGGRGIRPRGHGVDDLGHLGDRPGDGERHAPRPRRARSPAPRTRAATTSSAVIDHDGAEEREEDAGCRARAACRRRHTPPRVGPSRPIRPQPGASGIRRPTVLAGRAPQRRPENSEVPTQSEAKMALQIPQTQSFKLPGYNWRRGKTGVGQAHLAVHRGDHRGRARRDDRPDLARRRRRARADRQGLRRPHQDDDRADHLLHDRRRRRLDRQGRHRRQDRRPRAAVLHGHDDVRARDRPGRRQHHPPRSRA